MNIDPQLKSELKEYVLQKLHDQKKKVQLSSAYKLSSEDLQLLKSHLPFLKEAQIEESTNHELLAGIIITFGSKMIDLSLKGQLREVTNILHST